jgi:hypothetical protein
MVLKSGAGKFEKTFGIFTHRLFISLKEVRTHANFVLTFATFLNRRITVSDKYLFLIFSTFFEINLTLHVINLVINIDANRNPITGVEHYPYARRYMVL